MARKVGGILFVLVLAVGILVFTRSQSGKGNTKHELKIPFISRSTSDTKVTAKESLLLERGFAKALDHLRSAGAVRVESMRIAPGLVTAEVPSGSDNVTLQVKPGDEAKKTDTSLRGADLSKTRPLEAVNPGAPERLAREGARQLHLGFGTVDYVTYDAEGLFGAHWFAYFKSGARADGDMSGRVLKTHP
jgi:hypothetical protein